MISRLLLPGFASGAPCDVFLRAAISAHPSQADSPNVVEGKFSEGSSSLGTKDPKIRNLSDPLLYLMEI
jgi:hypothetical protein